MNEFSENEYPFRSQTALLLSSALPFIKPRYRHLLELAMKLIDLFESFRLYKAVYDDGFNFNEDSADSESISFISRYVTDVEGLLNALKKNSSGNMQEVFDMISTLANAKKLYETYGDVFSVFGQQSDKTDNDCNTSEDRCENTNSTYNSDNSSCAGGSSGSLVSSLEGMLNKEQKETLDLLKTLLDS